jgi:hypothetical protein
MSTEDNKAFMHRVYEEVSDQRDLTLLDEVCVPDFVVDYPSRTLQGLQAYKHVVSLESAPFGLWSL